MKKILNKQYESIINVDNIVGISKRKINKIFKDEEMKYREIILHNLIDEWWKLNKKTDHSFSILKKIIKKTGIVLNQVEKHNLFLIEERVFSLDRHIKILEVGNKLLSKEVVGAKFLKATIFKNNNRLDTFGKGDLLLTNRRLIIENEDSIAFFWINIKKRDYANHGFEFSHKEERFVVRIHDQDTLNNTIKNFASKKVKKWNH